MCFKCTCRGAFSRANSNTALALPSAQDSITAGQAQDSATNTNNGIFSKLIGGVLGAPLGTNSLSGSTAAAGPTVGGSLFNGLKSFF